MQYLKFLILGLLLGIVMTKAEIISWFRIYEMFRFESFHMYGVIGTAIILGIILMQFTLKKQIRDITGKPIIIHSKNMSISRYLIGGIIFGLGWALSGACPGPMFILLGTGYSSVLLVILGAILGTFVYGIMRNKLPH